MQDQSPYQNNNDNGLNSGPAPEPKPVQPVQNQPVVGAAPQQPAQPVQPATVNPQPTPQASAAPQAPATPQAQTWGNQPAAQDQSPLGKLKAMGAGLYSKLPDRFRNTKVAVIAAAVVLVGGVFIVRGLAAGPFISIQPEEATLSTGAVQGADTNASGGKYVQFGQVTTTPTDPTDPTDPIPTTGATVPNLKIAFQGDSSLNVETKAALSLVKSEGAQAMFHMGDMTYSDQPTNFESQLNGILGASFPVMGVVGNHDSTVSTYTSLFNARLAKTPDLKCTGTMAVQFECRFKGLHLVGTAPGLAGTGHDAYIRDKLAADNSIWSVCFWHYNMTNLQVGGKDNDAGWGPYEECRKGAGIAMQGHEHSYHRTKTLTDMTNQIVDTTCSDPNNVCVGPGRTYSTVNGAGGVGTTLRDQNRCLPTTYPYGCKGEWAKISTASQGGKHGILFITFNVDGNPKKANAYFKDITGKIVDQYTITRN